jgi:tRNA1(Val) A37 N6-methylase TrmN6
MQLTEDRFLGGRIVARQPAEGFRSGLDAVMVAAAVPAEAGDEVLEMGCGVGVASLCLASRVPGAKITGIELEESLVALANENAVLNGMATRLEFIAADAMAPPLLQRRTYDHVFCNPPFHDGAGRRSPSSKRAVARYDDGALGRWIESGLKRVRSQGSFTVIVRADRLAEVLAALPERGVSVLPLWPARGKPATRVIAQSRKASRAPLNLLAGLVLHEADGHYTEKADAILTDSGLLALAGRPL